MRFSCSLTEIPAALLLMSSNSRTRPVAMRPGMSWFTLIPCLASSFESVFASAATDARSTLDNARSVMGSRTDDDVNIKILPPQRSIIEGATTRTVRTVLSKISSNAFCQPASSNEFTLPGGGPPEFVTSRSMPPKRSTVFRCHVAMFSAEQTSATHPIVVPPTSSWTRAEAFAMASRSREAIETMAPSLARVLATAKPSPRLAPATIATFPFNPKSMTPSAYRTSYARVDLVQRDQIRPSLPLEGESLLRLGLPADARLPYE